MNINKNFQITCILCMLFITLVFHSPVSALPPDPENAALVYYLSFCLYEKPDETMKDLLESVATGEMEPNRIIKKYIDSCRPAIDYAEKAVDLDKCDWGIRYSDGLESQLRYVGEGKMLAYLMLADSRIAMSKGERDLAIKRCLNARKLSVHIGKDPVTIGAITENSLEKHINTCLQEILFLSQLNLDCLSDLKTELNEIDSKSEPITFSLKTEQETMGMYLNPKKIEELLPWLKQSTKSLIKEYGDLRECIKNDKGEFSQKNLKYYNAYWAEIFPLFEIQYQQAYTKMKELCNKADEDSNTKPEAFYSAYFTPPFHRMYNSEIQSRSSTNALKTALELYTAKVKTGKFPNELPDGIPKDPFSGKDFIYKKTSDGFILRCQGKDLKEDKIHEYEFKVK